MHYSRIFIRPGKSHRIISYCKSIDYPEVENERKGADFISLVAKQETTRKSSSAFPRLLGSSM